MFMGQSNNTLGIGERNAGRVYLAISHLLTSRPLLGM